MQKAWLLSPHKVMSGSLSQALGLAQALQVDHQVIHAQLRAHWRRIPLLLQPHSLAIYQPLPQDMESWPHFVIASAKQTIPMALAIKKQNPKAILIYLQNPRRFHQHFDLVVQPQHDHYSPHAITTLGALHRASPLALEHATTQLPPCLNHNKRPIVAVLVGGHARSHKLDLTATQRLISALQQLAERHSIQLAILPSRRTPADTREQLIHFFAKHHYVWQGDSTSPYLAILAKAARFIITEESVSMVSEAASTGKPIELFPLTHSRHSKRLEDFQQQMQQRGIVRWFDGNLSSWHYTPLRETQRIAQLIREKVSHA